jgi:hypothetical protein
MILKEKVFRRNATISCELLITFSSDIKTCVGKMEFLSEINWKRGQLIHEIEKNLIVYFLQGT